LRAIERPVGSGAHCRIIAPVADVWAGIVRVSHMGKRRADAADFHSERDQIHALREAVKRLGGRLDLLPSELDVSGGLPLEKRPSLLRAVIGIEEGRYCGIVIAYQSRLSRDPEVEEQVWRRVEAAGGRVEMALDPLDTSTVDGRMVRRIRGAINAGERDRHAERFEELREKSTAAGIWQRRQTPLGYTRGRERKLVPDRDAPRVRDAFRRRAEGEAIVRIADRLGMTASGARQLLRNRVYLGELRVGKHVNPAAHTALVTVEEFEAAQVSVARPGRGVSLEPALLAGIVRCQSCGHVMSRSRAARVVYVCHGRSSAGRCPAPAAVTAALLDALVTSIALAELDALIVRSTEGRGRVRDARLKLAAAERELAAYLSAVSASDVGVEAFAASARERSGRVELAREALQRNLALHPVAPELRGGREAWDALDGHGRNPLLRALLEVVIVRRAGGRGARTPLGERVRVIAHGAGLLKRSRGGGVAAGVVALPFPDLDDERVLRVAGSEELLEAASGVV
jgi:DNA invertase Pin-like site-specific DNA recombinase